ncbi:tumor necrosis factor receptor superfamily member 1A, partial [Biomphalaria glabrata]
MFNAHNGHSYESCFPCTIPNKYEKEVKLKDFTLTTDTEISCIKNYLRNVFSDHEASCDRCSECKEVNT